MTDRKKFLQFMALMSEIFSREISPTLLEVYWQSLDSVSDEAAENVFNRAIRELKFFPKPAELLELAGGGAGSLADKAEVEFSAVVQAVDPYVSVVFADLVTAAVIEKGFGGWIKFCTELTDDNLKWFRRDFIAMYQAYHGQGVHHVGKLTGLIERDNLNAGYLKDVPEPVMIGVGTSKQLPAE